MTFTGLLGNFCQWDSTVFNDAEEMQN